MATAYTGNGPYCYSNSLHMCLTQAGMAAVPPMGLLECMTGTQSSASFLALDDAAVLSEPRRHNQSRSQPHAGAETIGWL